MAFINTSSDSSSVEIQDVNLRIRSLGYIPGGLPTGPKNSILDVPGVQIGQSNMTDLPTVNAGVTVLFPRPPSEISIPCYAGWHVLNGNGEVTGFKQIKDWGYTNTPIALTNSCSIGIVMHELWQWVLEEGRKDVDAQGKVARMKMARNYGTPVVGETSDWWMNDYFKSFLPAEIVKEAIAKAANGNGQETVLEGQHGSGAGMTCHQFPGGTGTSSRVVKGVSGQYYTVGVLVQANYGHKEFLRVGGVPVGKLLMKESGDSGGSRFNHDFNAGKAGEGSIVILIFTDAPMLPHQLTRLAQRATVGLSQVGAHGTGRNSSGDIFLALSTANRPNEQMLGAGNGQLPDFRMPIIETNDLKMIKNECVDAVFRAASEATEEAILNSLVASREGRMTWDGTFVEGLPVEKVKELLKEYLVDV